MTGVLLYADFKADESYTPQKVTIWAGNDFNDMRAVADDSMIEPRGWHEIKISNEYGAPLRTWLMQVLYKQNCY